MNRGLCLKRNNYIEGQLLLSLFMLSAAQWFLTENKYLPAKMTIHFHWYGSDRIIRVIRMSRTNVGNGHFRKCDDRYFRFLKYVSILTRLSRTARMRSSWHPSFLWTSWARRPPRWRCSPASSISFDDFGTKFLPEILTNKLLRAI